MANIFNDFEKVFFLFFFFVFFFGKWWLFWGEAFNGIINNIQAVKKHWKDKPIFLMHLLSIMMSFNHFLTFFYISNSGEFRMMGWQSGSHIFFLFINFMFKCGPIKQINMKSSAAAAAAACSLNVSWTQKDFKAFMIKKKKKKREDGDQEH